jgi:hypothetical protein
MEYRFIYGDSHDDPPAYRIFPSDRGSVDIHHQYGCNCCDQFSTIGFLLPLVGEVGQRVENLIGPCSGFRMEQNAEIIDIFGVPVERVMGEALVLLADGSYLACCNCD